MMILVHDDVIVVVEEVEEAISRKAEVRFPSKDPCPRTLEISSPDLHGGS